MLEAFKLPINVPNKVNMKGRGKKDKGDVEELGRVGPIERETPCLSTSAGLFGAPRMKLDGRCCRDKATRKGKVLERIGSGKGYHNSDSVAQEASADGQMGQKCKTRWGSLFFS